MADPQLEEIRKQASEHGGSFLQFTRAEMQLVLSRYDALLKRNEAAEAVAITADSWINNSYPMRASDLNQAVIRWQQAKAAMEEAK